MNESIPSPPASPEGRFWAAIVIAAAIAIAFLGGAVRGFRPLPSGHVPDDTPIPLLVAPEGHLPAPPSVFRWTPGGPDVDFSQVLVFNDRYERLWQSAPVEGNELTVDPERVFNAAIAGQVLFWSVREVYRGRPRAASAVVEFSFDVDVRGFGIGESKRGEVLLDR